MNYLITSLSTCFSLHFSATERFNPRFAPAETFMFGVPAMSFYKSAPSAEARAGNICSKTWGRNLAGAVMSARPLFAEVFYVSLSSCQHGAALQGMWQGSAVSTDIESVS